LNRNDRERDDRRRRCDAPPAGLPEVQNAHDDNGKGRQLDQRPDCKESEEGARSNSLRQRGDEHGAPEEQGGVVGGPGERLRGSREQKQKENAGARLVGPTCADRSARSEQCQSHEHDGQQAEKEEIAFHAVPDATGRKPCEPKDSSRHRVVERWLVVFVVLYRSRRWSRSGVAKNVESGAAPLEWRTGKGALQIRAARMALDRRHDDRRKRRASIGRRERSFPEGNHTAEVKRLVRPLENR
jgi:hypothetical protein